MSPLQVVVYVFVFLVILLVLYTLYGWANNSYKNPVCTKEGDFYKIQRTNILGNKKYVGEDKPVKFNDEGTCKWYTDSVMAIGGPTYRFNRSEDNLITRDAAQSVPGSGTGA